MGFVGSLLAAEVDVDVARLETITVDLVAVGINNIELVVVAIDAIVFGRFGLKALGTGEALDDGAVHAEMFAAEILGQRFVRHGIEEGLGESVLFQSLAVLGEGAGIEGFVAGLHVEEPAEEEAEVDLFAELSFAADGVEGHEEEGFEEPFGRHAGASGVAVGGVEGGAHVGEDAVGASLDVAEWVVGPDAIFDAEAVEEGRLGVVRAAHGPSPEWGRPTVAQNPPKNQSFSARC